LNPHLRGATGARLELDRALDGAERVLFFTDAASSSDPRGRIETLASARIPPFSMSAAMPR
jgi:hypothetical protein